VIQAAGVEPWNAGAIHDTVGALLRDAGYHRSFWSSVAGRALLELGRFIVWLLNAMRSVPGGKTTVLTIIAVVIVLIAARFLLAGEWGDDLLSRRKAPGQRGMRIDPWTESERLAAGGDYLGAAHALYQAVLRRIAATERIRVHVSKTSGDYVRDLRRRGSPIATPFQRFGRRFDRIVFGKGECTRDDFDALRADALAIPDRQAAA
jgi:hypothetical protein